MSSESPRKPAQAVRAAPARDRYLRLRLKGGGEPRSNKAYVLKLDDGTVLKGKTSGDGVLVEKLPPTVRRAKLRLESAGLGVDESSLDLDGLAPPAGLSGVQQRLRNEGLLERVTGSLDEATRAALSLFLSSGHIQDLLAEATGLSDVCRRIPDFDDEDEPGARAAALLAEEKRSQAWLNGRLQELKGLSEALASARVAHEADRPKLLAIAWTLGVLQVVGWSLMFFVVLPQSLRVLKQQRAEKRGVQPQ